MRSARQIFGLGVGAKVSVGLKILGFGGVNVCMSLVKLQQTKVGSVIDSVLMFACPWYMYNTL